MASASASQPAPWPTQLKVSRDRRTLDVVFDNGSAFSLEAELLRSHSPSAEVQGHSPEQKVTVWGKRDVAMANLVPVGNYAVRIVFDDGHDTGIFSWSYLAELGRDKDALWTAYEAELAAKGLRR
ncbi:MAG: DUF971 domain-containing protein [Rhizobiaceae bacterium]|jgi:DUF971 family protein|nr:DUF971 domain-containing protein [Rhizobiaceae bacterium]